MAEPSPPTEARARSIRRWRRRLLAATLTLVVLLGLAGAWVYSLWRTPPAYWVSNQQLLAQDHATLESLAGTAERRLLHAFSAEGGIESGERRVVSMSFEEINAWLALRYENWSSYVSFPVPSQISQPMLASDGRRIIAAFEVRARGWRQVVSLINDVELRADGQGHMRLHAVRAGRLPVPFQKVFSIFGGDAAQHDAHRTLIALAMDGHVIDPVINHPGDARLRIRLLELNMTAYGVDATLRAEPRP
jgi:hypothetical protein